MQDPVLVVQSLYVVHDAVCNKIFSFAVLTYGLIWTSALVVPESSAIYPPDLSPPRNVTFSLLETSPQNTTNQVDSPALRISTQNDTGSSYDVLPTAFSPIIQCEPGSYGVNLDLSACNNALISFLVDPTRPQSTAQRGSGKRPNIVLPNRYSSCEYIQGSADTGCLARIWSLPVISAFAVLLMRVKANGKCVIDLVGTSTGLDTQAQDVITNGEIAHAASQIIKTCVTRHNQGGGVGGLGLSPCTRKYIDEY